MLKNLFFFLFVNISTYGQGITVKGKVLNSNVPVTNAIITLEKKHVISNFNNTDNNGVFEFRNIELNTKYFLKVKKLGFFEYNDSIIATNYDSVILKIYILHPLIKEDTILIVSKRKILEKGDTTIYKANAFIKGNENSLKDLLNNLPDVEVLADGKITQNGKLVTKILFEGEDLTGEQYEKISNNLSVNNIENLEFIDNYTDPLSFSSMLSRKANTELVLNLTFKKKSFLKSGRIAFGMGLPVKYTEQKADFLLQKKTVTNLLLANYNTIGKTTQDLTSIQNQNVNIYQNANIKKLQNPILHLNGINELVVPIDKKFITFNYTTYFDNSFAYRLKNLLINKINFSISPQTISQHQNNLNETFVGTRLLSSRTEENSIKIHSANLCLKNELLLSVSKSSRLNWNTLLISNKDDSKNTTLLNTVPTNSNSFNKVYFLNTSIHFAKMFRNFSLFESNIFYERNINNDYLQNSGILYNNVFFDSSIVNSFKQNNINFQNNFVVNSKYINRKINSTISISPNYKIYRGNFDIGTEAKLRNSNFYLKSELFTNKSDFCYNYLSVISNYSFDTGKISSSFTLEPLILPKIKMFSKEIKNTWAVNFNFRTTIEISKSQKLTLSFSKTNMFADLDKAIDNNAIINNNNILVGSNIFTSKSVFNTQANLNPSNITGRKSKIRLSLNYSLTNSNFITNNENNNSFSAKSYLNLSNKIDNIRFNVSHSLNSTTNSKLVFTNQYSIGLSNNISSQNSMLINSKTLRFNVVQNLKSRFERAFNFALINEFLGSINYRKYTSIKNSNLQNLTKLSLGLNYKKTTNFDLEFSHYLFSAASSSNKRNVNTFSFLNFSFTNNLKKGLGRIIIKGNNLLNNVDFKMQKNGITSFDSNVIRLIPFNINLQIEFNLR